MKPTTKNHISLGHGQEMRAIPLASGVATPLHPGAAEKGTEGPRHGLYWYRYIPVFAKFLRFLVISSG